MTWIDAGAFMWSFVPVVLEFYLLSWSVHKAIDATLKKGNVRMRVYGVLLLFRWMFLGVFLWAGIRFLGLHPVWVIGGVLGGTLSALIFLVVRYGKKHNTPHVSLSDIHVKEGL